MAPTASRPGILRCFRRRAKPSGPPASLPESSWKILAHRRRTAPGTPPGTRKCGDRNWRYSRSRCRRSGRWDRSWQGKLSGPGLRPGPRGRRVTGPPAATTRVRLGCRPVALRACLLPRMEHSPVVGSIRCAVPLPGENTWSPTCPGRNLRRRTAPVRADCTSRDDHSGPGPGRGPGPPSRSGHDSHTEKCREGHSARAG